VKATIDSKGILQATQLGEQTVQTVIQDAFVMIEPLFEAIIRLPPHALWPWWKLPLLGIELANRTEP
jgi:hypothetical protein